MTPRRSALLIDTTRCLGCKSCERACHDVNTPPEASAAPGRRVKRSVVRTRETRTGTVHYRHACLHCVDPACVSVCPVRALEKLPHGPVVYHANRCMGCRYCMMACPFGVPAYTWQSNRPVVVKCILCAPRIARGEVPACAATCPTGAVTYGEREELLQLGWSRIQAHPEQYQPRVYGDTEAGGTSVFVLSGVPFGVLGLPEQVRHEPYPELTWTVLEKIPFLVAIEAGVLAALYWIVRRREALRALASPAAKSAPAPASVPLPAPAPVSAPEAERKAEEEP